MTLTPEQKPPLSSEGPGYTQAGDGPPVGFPLPETSPCGKSPIRIWWEARECTRANRGGRGCAGRGFMTTSPAPPPTDICRAKDSSVADRHSGMGRHHKTRNHENR